MGEIPATAILVQLAEEYYRRADAGQPDVVDLFTEDVEIFFPKFGVGRGKAAFGIAKGDCPRSGRSVVHRGRPHSGGGRHDAR